MKRLIEVESDCLDIIQRIKAIDNDYFVVFNLDSQKYELHNAEQKTKTYCLTFPYDTLDERAYLHVLKTRVQNSDEIFKMLDAENLKVEEARIKQLTNSLKEKLYDS